MARPKGISQVAMARPELGGAKRSPRLGGARQEHFFLAAGYTLIALELLERDRQKRRAREREREHELESGRSEES